MSSVAADRYVEATDSASNELSILPESIDLNDREAIREAIDELSTGWSVDICEDDINFSLLGITTRQKRILRYKDTKPISCIMMGNTHSSFKIYLYIKPYKH